MITQRYDVSGMVCANCVSSVRDALTAIDGVLTVTVNLEDGTADVVSASEGELQPATVQHALDEVGYAASLSSARS